MAEIEKKVRDNFNKAFENALVEEEKEDEAASCLISGFII